MKQEIKLVVTDLDGTFTTSKYHFCPENARAIQRAQQAGVMVCDLVPDTAVQTYLFDTVDRARQSALAEAIDRINRKNGHDTVRIALQGYDTTWHIKSEHRSRQYTTRLDEIIQVKS